MTPRARSQAIAPSFIRRNQVRCSRNLITPNSHHWANVSIATHILIVKDEPEIRELLNFSLTRAGFRFTEAESAEPALQKLFNQQPDLVIVDWMLLRMNGVDLAKRVGKDALTSVQKLWLGHRPLHE